MSLPRIFHPADLNSNTVIALDEKASHHLLRVLRLAEGSLLQIFNGNQQEYLAEISSVDNRTCRVLLKATVHTETESPLSLHLGQGISRGEKMDFTIQKAVEMGVHRITPLLTEFCNVQLPPERWQKKMEHWQGIIISACEQSGRTRIPHLDPPTAFYSWIVQADPPGITNAENTTGLRLIFAPAGTRSLRDALPSHPISSVIFAIGPEGGFSAQELERAKQHHFDNIKLGNRILRTETAAIAAAAVLQNQFGDF